MYAKVLGSSLMGMNGFIVDIETDLSNGLPQFQIVGLPDSAIRESKERVRAAIKNSDYKFPMNRITINLAPADIKKEGSGFDLPMAIAILLADEQIILKKEYECIEDTLFIGELSLDGSLQSVNGILSMVMAAKEKGITKVIVPKINIEEASLVKGIETYGFSNLNETIDFIEKNLQININNYPNQDNEQINFKEIIEDFADVKGHYQIKRAVEVAVAGMHNLILIGPPGSGKSMIAKRIPSVLPELTWDEMLEVTKIYSVAGELNDRGKLVNIRPFRSPHHSISTPGLIGGGQAIKPGEISLSHRGVLFLDELPEFSRSSLESMRQPLEDGCVTISRAKSNYTFPCEVMFVGAMNPCKCGYYGSDVPNHECQCTPLEVKRYRTKLSGPLLDRVDISIEVPWLNIETLRDKKVGKTSTEMRKSIKNAREIQNKRFKDVNIKYNSEMSSKLVRKYCFIDNKAEKILNENFNKFGFSGRTLDRIFKISRTIADIENSQNIELSHIAEALNYRILDKQL